MVLWVTMAVMTGVALAVVLVPLVRAGGRAKGGSDVAVYRDQLDEIVRDLARGVISPVEADAARIEVSRRLIAAADARKYRQTDDPVLKPAIVLISLCVPAVAFFGYSIGGSPALEGKPIASRVMENPENVEIGALIARVETHLKADPDDGRGWEILAPVYLRSGRYAEAVSAYRAAIRLLGATAERHANLGEAMVAEASGIVTEAAGDAFNAALVGDPKSAKARTFLAIAAEQDGRLGAARGMWRALADDAPTGSRWRQEIEARLARLDTARSDETMPGPDAATMRAAEDLSRADRQEMIAGMVARLDKRLTREGGSIDEWLRLVRSYMVMNRADDARAALARARHAYRDDSRSLTRIDAAASTLGIGG